MEYEVVTKEEAVIVLNELSQKIYNGTFGNEIRIETVVGEIQDELDNAELNRE